VQAAARTVQAGRGIVLDKLGIDLGSVSLQAVGPEIGAVVGTWVAEKVRGITLPDFHLPKWNLIPGTPDVGGAFGLVVDVGKAIAEKVAGIVPDVPLPSWKINFPNAPEMDGLNFDTVSNWVQTKMGEIAGVVVKFTNWTLEIGTPDTVTVATGLAGGLWDVIKDNLVPLSIGGGGSGTESDPLQFAANVTIDGAAAQGVIDGLKDSLTAFSSAVWTTDLDASRANFDRVLSDADTAGGDFENNPYVGIINGDRSLWDAVLWGAIQGGLGFAATTFSATISAIDNASGVISSILGLLNAIPTTVTSTVNVNTVTSTTARAAGGFVREPFTLVGERGPEVVSLPRGSYVHTAAESRHMGYESHSGGGGGIRINTLYLMPASPQFEPALRASVVGRSRGR
jgi:hypothetical protein